MKSARISGLIVVVTAVVAVSVHSQRIVGQTEQAGAPQGDLRPADPETNTTRTNKEELERWMKELSNWGRWGKDDQLGTVNLITPQKRTEAAKLVKTGIVVSMANNKMPEKIAAQGGGQSPSSGSSAMAIRFSQQGRTSFIHEENHALATTHAGPHFDAICHVAFDGKTYNGFTLNEIVTKDGGCSKMGVGGFRDKIVTRGILVDIARMKGLPRLEPNMRIYKEDIEAFEKWAKLKFEPGDAFFYRGGLPEEQRRLQRAGLDPSFIPFLKQRDIALFGGDMRHDLIVPGFGLPVHTLLMVALGMPMFDYLDLEALSETAAKIGRWEFMLVATPDASAHGTGSQIAAIAIF